MIRRVYISIVCTIENSLPMFPLFIETLRFSAYAFFRGLFSKLHLQLCGNCLIVLGDKGVVLQFRVNCSILYDAKRCSFVVLYLNKQKA